MQTIEAVNLNTLHTALINLKRKVDLYNNYLD